ncbi:3-isopropylmalate dehydratase large subunit [Arvimicrobium flavum]|uniref:3-isopropylmalate dehydratase large subunit n=1 Tax=Arvimicrobium flavum TaxID=3393320 RepID=UPI00237A1BCA|nr:3-isopropylmalate dehydratase large subunit [Mesorhizobium shangrilense]
MPTTLFDKLWSRHAVMEHPLAGTLLFIDRHLLHEGSRNAFSQLRRRGLQVRRPDLSTAVVDHYAPTTSRDVEQIDVASRRQVIADLASNAGAAGVEILDLAHPSQGIVHVIGPELGLTRPGMTIVCGDSHTATHGAMGALAFGIGASQVAHVLATQTLWQKKPKQMRIVVRGSLRPHVTAKDLILAIIARVGAAGGTGYAIEYAGPAVEALSLEGRLTLCNMTIEAGARFGLVAPDQVTFDYLRERAFDADDAGWQARLDEWRELRTETGAAFDSEIEMDATSLKPMITWGTSPEDGVSVDGVVPDPASIQEVSRRNGKMAALDYMGLMPGTAIEDIRFDRVFIGSCTNGRIEDLRAAARAIGGRKAVIPAMVVPGSMAVRAQAEREGLDTIFLEAGFEWRMSGCSMCAGMNGDLGRAGERCASTSNRNFVGRQGAGVRTHLMNPAMAATIAVTGHPVDISEAER